MPRRPATATAPARPTTTAPTRSRSSKGSRRSASGRRCTSARPARRGCTTSSTRSSTTRSTRRWPGFCDQVNVTLHIDNSVTVVDNGRGIPVDQHTSGRSAAEVVLTVLHAGGKFDNDSYKVSGGLHGVGVSVVNALSETLDLEIWRNGQVYQQSYERGTPIGRPRGHRHDEEARHQGHVQARRADLRDDRVQLRHAGAAPARARLPERRRHDHASTTSATARATSSSTRAASTRSSQYLNQNKAAVNDKPIYMHGEKDGIDVEIALQWNDGYTETVYSFANNINTHEGGTHLSGLPLGADADDQLLRRQEQPREGPEGREHRRRRHPRGADRRHQRQDPAAAVRRADQDEARQHRGQGHRRGDRQRQARRVPRGEPGGRQAGHRQGGRRRARARGGAQGARPGAPQGRARQQRAARQARRLPGARPGAERDLHRRRGVGRRLGEAGARPALPGDPADQGQDPERREGALRQDARQRRDQDDDRGARLRHRHGGLRRRQDCATTASSS